jgi:hypothetical protein
LNYALDEFEAMRRLVPGLEQTEVYGTELRFLIAEINERLFRLVEESSLAFESGDRSPIHPEETKAYVERARARLVRARNHFVAENIYRLMEPVAQDCASGPAMAPQVH